MPGQDMPADRLIRMADEAMYAAKRAGRNKVVTWNQLHEPAPTAQPGASEN
jgi:PleD family two-component response regulator